MDWRYFELSKVGRNEMLVRKNLKKITGTKMAKKLNNFENFDTKNQIRAYA